MPDNEDLSSRVREGKNSKIAWIGLVFCATSLYFIFNPVKCSAPDLSWMERRPSAPAETLHPVSPCPPAKERKEIRVQVDPVEWSGWVKIPPNCWWEVNRPGCWEEYWFIDDRKVKSGIGETINVGSIPNNTFRVRGTRGEIVISYEPK